MACAAEKVWFMTALQLKAGGRRSRFPSDAYLIGCLNACVLLGLRDF
jgi:hypothetical protein